MSRKWTFLLSYFSYGLSVSIVNSDTKLSHTPEMESNADVPKKESAHNSKLRLAAEDWVQRIRRKCENLFRTLKTIRALLINPGDTEKAFEVIAALRGNSLKKSFKRFQNSASGNKILQDKIDLINVISNREVLSQYDQDSFGHAYLQFIETHHLAPEGLVNASADMTRNIQNEDVLRYVKRNRDSHDLWHTLTQYGRDPLGELCLLAFTYAQTKNSGVGLIALLGSFRLYRIYGHGTFGAIWKAYRDGKRASWLPEQPFETLLPLNIDHVRIMLSIPHPNAYLLVMSRQRAIGR